MGAFFAFVTYATQIIGRTRPADNDEQSLDRPSKMSWLAILGVILITLAAVVCLGVLYDVAATWRR